MATTERLSSDRRKSIRVPLSAGVNFFHVLSNRTFPARSVDISDGGIQDRREVRRPFKDVFVRYLYNLSKPFRDPGDIFAVRVH
jgi:c-di-GMP-binding flagellar brake protein YcgR